MSGLAFDPSSVMVQDPGMILDPKFLGALRAELREEFGDEEAETTLLQMGFLHGLRDALRAVQETPGGPGPPPAPLAIRFRTQPSRGALVLHGSWPERCEATARLSLSGSCARGGCAFSAGYTSGWLSGIFEADILAVETSCGAAGDETCAFEAREAALWETEIARGAPAAAKALDSLPFALLRDCVARLEPGGQGDGRLDPREAVIHIWGPVMVIPFTSLDEATAAVELMGSDPGAAEVSVIVVDLTGAMIDEAFGAVALERIIETVETWGAEVILAGVSPLSMPVLERLERPPILLQKDLNEAIAAAFRIADSQRRVL